MPRTVSYTKKQVRHICRGFILRHSRAAIAASFNATFADRTVDGAKVLYVTDKFGRNEDYGNILTHNRVPYDSEDDYECEGVVDDEGAAGEEEGGEGGGERKEVLDSEEMLSAPSLWESQDGGNGPGGAEPVNDDLGSQFLDWVARHTRTNSPLAGLDGDGVVESSVVEGDGFARSVPVVDRALFWGAMPGTDAPTALPPALDDAANFTFPEYSDCSAPSLRELAGQLNKTIASFEDRLREVQALSSSSSLSTAAVAAALEAMDTVQNAEAGLERLRRVVSVLRGEFMPKDGSGVVVDEASFGGEYLV